MLEDILTRRNVAQSLRSGPASPYVDDYVEWLEARRYRNGTMSLYLHALAGYSAWVEGLDRTFGEDAVALVDAFHADLDARGELYRPVAGRRDKLRWDCTGVRRFTDFLIEAGVATPRRREPSIEERYPLLQEFAAWQTRHRGLRASSVRAYLVVLERLLITVGTDPTTYTATRLREFVCNEGAKFGIERAATITVATRSLVRFLVATGRAPAGMDQAIPRAAIWGRFRSSLPRYIEPDDIERAIASCDPATPAGTRDRAIVLLLARLGLRAGEVAALRFDDIDWADGRIGVTGKGRRRHWLPLPQEVGDAILAYVRGVRPEVASAFVFVRLLAPFGGLRMETVANVAARSLRRSGVKAPTYGSHVFRHSVATTMLREGATLAGIGAVLRHRSPETTAHYAKVDIAMLAEIAQPWPEVSPC